MSLWSSQHYKFEGENQGIDDSVIDSSISVIERIQKIDARLPIILTLRHLSLLTDCHYGYLRKVVSRESREYKRILFKKKVPGRSRFREIHVPEQQLLEVQQWITATILTNTKAHLSSFAYHPNSQPIHAAKRHCGCKWLLKIDIEDFFHSISERMIYKVFRDLGYTKLLSLELARITTAVKVKDNNEASTDTTRWSAIPSYCKNSEGFLPQGAPSSPMLSNLVMKSIDEKLATLAKNNGFTYTRYADDLAFSTKQNVGMSSMKQLSTHVSSLLSEEGFKLNRRKSVIRGPGARRVILGILVDSKTPRLSREFKDQLRQHLYYLCSLDHGPSKHADTRKMSVSTLFHHIRGKIAWAEKVEPKFGANCLAQFNVIKWPPLDY